MILRLAFLWEMTEVRKRAIRRLDQIDRFPSPVAKLSCGREFEHPHGSGPARPAFRPWSAANNHWAKKKAIRWE